MRKHDSWTMIVFFFLMLAFAWPVLAQQGWDVQKDRQIFKSETVIQGKLNSDAELRLRPDDNRTANYGWRLRATSSDGGFVIYNELSGAALSISTGGVVTIAGNMNPTCDDINVDGNELDILFDEIESSLNRGTVNLIVSENSAAAASNDVTGTIVLFQHYNETGGAATNLVTFGQIVVTATDVTVTTEDSTVAFQTITAGSATTALTLTGDDVAVAGDATVTGLTASKPVFTDSNKKLVSIGTMAVDQGGSGATSLTDHGVLVGSGTAAVTALSVGGANEALMGAAGADPAFRALDDADIPNSITVTNYYTKAEADAAYATAAEGDAGTNAQALVTAGADPGHTHTAYASSAQGTSATNAETVLATVFGSVDVATAPVSATQATITCTCKNVFGDTLADDKTFTFWFSTPSVQTVPSIEGIESWSYVAHGEVNSYWDLYLTSEGTTTNYVYVGTTHTDGTMDFLVTAESGPWTNYFHVLGPNGTYSKTAIAYTD